MKEMTSVAQTVATDEERAELEKEGVVFPATAGHDATSPNNTQPATPAGETPPSLDGGATQPSSPQANPSAIALTPPTGTEDSKRTSMFGSSASGSRVSPTSPEKDKEKEKDGHVSGKRRSKLTQEQKKKLQELEDERRKALEERVKDLTTKLIERLRPFVDAKHPGEKDDPETKAFQEKMRLEAEDLKLESFGVEVRLSFRLSTARRCSIGATRSCSKQSAQSTS